MSAAAALTSSKHVATAAAGADAQRRGLGYLTEPGQSAKGRRPDRRQMLKAQHGFAVESQLLGLRFFHRYFLAVGGECSPGSATGPPDGIPGRGRRRHGTAKPYKIKCGN